jgi:hypothetical protein
MPSHAIQMVCSDGQEVLGGLVTATGDVAVEYNLTVAASTADQSFAVNIPFANLQSLCIEYKDSSGNYLGGVLETQSGSSPTDTITLTAGAGPLLWKAGCGLAKPLTANLTTLFVSPGSATAGAMKVRATYNL